MKVVFYDSNYFNVYLNKYYIKDINFRDSDDVESQFKKIFNNLKKNYKIDIKGFYDVDVYINDNYGVILEIEKEDIDFISMKDESVDMRIKFKMNSKFLYEIDDFFIINDLNKEDADIYYHNNKFYIDLKKELNLKDMMRLIENSKIIYNNIDTILFDKKM